MEIEEKPQVHVHRMDIAAAAISMQSLRSVLTEDEIRRAAGMRLRSSRDAFVAARGQLRMLLGARLGCDPADAGISASDPGKPRLADPPGPEIRFNFSHSGNIGLVAIAESGPVGIAVARIDAPNDVNGLLGTGLSDTERERFGSKATRIPSPAGRPPRDAICLRDIPRISGYSSALAATVPSFHIHGREI